MNLAREWFTAPDLAGMAIPGLPTIAANVRAMAERERWQRADWAGNRWRFRKEKGGGVEYHYTVLPPEARNTWIAAFTSVGGATEWERVKSSAHNDDLWAAYWSANENTRGKADRRHRIVLNVVKAIASGRPRTNAVIAACAEFNVSQSSVYGWLGLIEGVHQNDWVPALLPRHGGGHMKTECTEKAWDALYLDYARKEKPTFSSCYRRIKGAAKKNGWIVPSEDTLWRRMQALDPRQLALARGGADALKRMEPIQRRDRTVYHALEAVNADGHKFDVKVDFGDGYVGRPMVLAFQDIYSGKFLSARIGKTENTNLVRLGIGDVVQNYGVPKHCFLDNGRAFASKEMTGGTKTRFRGRIRDEDPEGIFVRLGIEVHFTTPYSGQSKPIERGFGDFARDIARDIRLAGAYLGNDPLNKPANYGEKVAPLALFKLVLEEGIAEHNARIGRRSDVCGGKLSFDQVFNASYEQSAIQKVGPGQKLLWLPATDGILVRDPDGHIEFQKNLYQADFLLPLRGKRVTARFDPDALHEGLHIFHSEGAYLGLAECNRPIGFNSKPDAEALQKSKASLRKRARQLDADARKLSTEEFLRLTASEEPAPPLPEAKVIRPLFRGSNALAPAEQLQRADEEIDELFIRASEERRASRLRLVVDAGDD